MQEDFISEALGKQLRCPSGKYAKEVGENMFQSNSNMIFRTIDELDIQPNSEILEIGFGNGKHLTRLFDNYQELKYTGIDISEDMVNEAATNNLNLVKNKFVQLFKVNPNEKLNFTTNSFNYCFTVNTIYFFEHPLQYFKEIYRTLKPKGKFAVGFVNKEFGEKLPFTQKNFTFYESEEVKEWYKQIGFMDICIKDFTENVVSKDRQHVTRPFSIITAVKQ